MPLPVRGGKPRHIILTPAEEISYTSMRSWELTTAIGRYGIEIKVAQVLDVLGIAIVGSHFNQAHSMPVTMPPGQMPTLQVCRGGGSIKANKRGSCSLRVPTFPGRSRNNASEGAIRVWVKAHLDSQRVYHAGLHIATASCDSC